LLPELLSTYSRSISIFTPGTKHWVFFHVDGIVVRSRNLFHLALRRDRQGGKKSTEQIELYATYRVESVVVDIVRELRSERDIVVLKRYSRGSIIIASESFLYY